VDAFASGTVIATQGRLLLGAGIVGPVLFVLECAVAVVERHAR
jgi:hypothetical protein